MSMGKVDKFQAYDTCFAMSNFKKIYIKILLTTLLTMCTYFSQSDLHCYLSIYNEYAILFHETKQIQNIIRKMCTCHDICMDTSNLHLNRYLKKYEFF